MEITPTPVGSCPIPATPATPSWAADVYPLLHSPTCGAAAISCHGGAGAQGRLNYSVPPAALHAALMNQSSTTFNVAGWFIVKSGDASRSWLYEKIAPAIPGEPGRAATGSKTGSQMPLGGNLCRATTDTVKRWIDQGALNN